MIVRGQEEVFSHPLSGADKKTTATTSPLLASSQP
jgi:hypothetical protein